jgi:hypothetical protein
LADTAAHEDIARSAAVASSRPYRKISHGCCQWAYQRDLLAYHTRAQAAAVEKAQVRKALGEIKRGGGL